MRYLLFDLNNCLTCKLAICGRYAYHSFT